MTKTTDLFYVFTGIPGSRIMAALNGAINKRGDLHTTLAGPLRRYPLESLTGFLLSASVAFYLAERGVNPKIQTFVDALYYIGTCLSVGYADIFARTQTGKLIATLVMTLGPALTGGALDPPDQGEPASSHGQELILQRLDAILEELRRTSLPYTS